MTVRPPSPQQSLSFPSPELALDEPPSDVPSSRISFFFSYLERQVEAILALATIPFPGVFRRPPPAEETYFLLPSPLSP